jgi:hypothetical protein
MSVLSVDLVGPGGITRAGRRSSPSMTIAFTEDGVLRRPFRMLAPLAAGVTSVAAALITRRR